MPLSRFSTGRSSSGTAVVPVVVVAEDEGGAGFRSDVTVGRGIQRLAAALGGKHACSGPQAIYFLEGSVSKESTIKYELWPHHPPPGSPHFTAALCHLHSPAF